MAVSEAIVWAECWGHIPFFIRKLPGEKLDAGGLPRGCIAWCDSTSAIDVARSEMHRPKARWMALRWHKVRDHAEALRYCVSERQRADVFTKCPTVASIEAKLGSHGFSAVSDLAAHS